MRSLYPKIAALTIVLGCLNPVAPAFAFHSGSPQQQDPAPILQPGLRHVKGPAATLSRFDNNRTVSLKLGQKVAIDLAVPMGTDHFDPTLMWSGLDLSSDQFLRPENTNAMFILKPGVTGQTFEAIHPGTTVITSHRTIPGATSQQDWTVIINSIG